MYLAHACQSLAHKVHNINPIGVFSMHFVSTQVGSAKLSRDAYQGSIMALQSDHKSAVKELEKKYTFADHVHTWTSRHYCGCLVRLGQKYPTKTTAVPAKLVTVYYLTTN